jgi:hypothetical protein
MPTYNKPQTRLHNKQQQQEQQQNGNGNAPDEEDESGLFNVYKKVNETLTTIQGVIRTIAM